MNKQSREALDAYYAEAESWATDQQDSLRASRRTAWIVAGVALAVALLEGFALLLLTPLKTVVPYTLLVDRNTGFVQALEPLDPAKVSADTALTQSFLVQYVIAREGFDFDTLQADYRKVGLWSAEQARSGYVAGMQISSPQSPLALYPRTTVVETRVKSVSPVGRNVAMVRFDTVRRDAGGRVEPARPWVAVIRYRYSGEPLRLEDRLVNPLGFQVLRYRRDAEALPPEPAPAPAPSQAAARPTVVAVPGSVQVQTSRTTETRKATSDEPTYGAPEL
ncbi:MAG TPA: VirB8/TrbF family protein [Allosphingosinicella sp.]|jgi:type IV secretion system protein VirB8